MDRMAQDDPTGTLLKSLVAAYGFNPEAQQARHLDLAKSLAASSLTRINHFEVEQKTRSLVEKLRILNKDDHANALEGRLDRLLASDGKWVPECLSLLLTLSNRPAHKVRLNDLALLEESRTAVSIPTDSLIDDEIHVPSASDIWRNVDFAEETMLEDIADGTSISPSETCQTNESQSASDTEDITTDLQELFLPSSEHDYEDLQKEWTHGSVGIKRSSRPLGADQLNLVEVGEETAIRETVFMLKGLPSQIFKREKFGYSPSLGTAKLQCASPEVTASMLEQVAELGRKLERIRRYINQRVESAVIQKLQELLSKSMRRIDQTLNEIQGSLINDEQSCTTSFHSIFRDLAAHSQGINLLFPVVEQFDAIEEPKQAVKVLEHLFELSCYAQTSARDNDYETVANAFFACFQSYLVPLNDWMKEGQIGKSGELFFISKRHKAVPLASTWQQEYELCEGTSESSLIPFFIQQSAAKILNAGKSINLLRKLGYHSEALDSPNDDEELFSFQTVCLSTDPKLLRPFEDVFEKAFIAWLNTWHRLQTLKLHQTLYDFCGLERALVALQDIFFLKDTFASQKLVSFISKRLDVDEKRELDSLILTDAVRKAFSQNFNVNTDSLHASSLSRMHSDKIIHKSPRNGIYDINLEYVLPWPIATIIQPDTANTYLSVFQILLQLHRSRYVLLRIKLPQELKSRVDKKKLQLIYRLRMQLLHYTNIFIGHISSIVLQNASNALDTEMAAAADIDGMILAHATYIAKIADQCMLADSHQTLQNAVLSVLDLCVILGNIMCNISQDASQARLETSGRPPRLPSRASESDVDSDTDTTRPVMNDETGKPVATRSDLERLSKIARTFSQLLDLIYNNVRALGKAEGGFCWELLASHLSTLTSITSSAVK